MATATVTPLDALRRYETALTDYEALTTDEMIARAVGALDTVLRNWRHTIDAFADAMGVTRGTIYHWRNLKRAIPPAQVHRACQVFCAPVTPANPHELEQWADQVAGPAGELFNLFYSPDQQAAVTWLFEHYPTHFEWVEPMVA